MYSTIYYAHWSNKMKLTKSQLKQIIMKEMDEGLGDLFGNIKGKAAAGLKTMVDPFKDATDRELELDVMKNIIQNLVPEGSELNDDEAEKLIYFLRDKFLESPAMQKKYGGDEHYAMGLAAMALSDSTGGRVAESKMIKREDLAEEMKLREQIRKAIKIVRNKREAAQKQQVSEEQELRNIIRRLIEAEVSTEVPGRSTGINVLEDLLKKIIPIIEDDYKQLTTNPEQRQSYRTHIVNGIQSLLAPAAVTDEINEIDIEVGEEEGEDFIDVREPEEEEAPELDPDLEKFGVEGEDETGRNMAYETFKKVENNILNSYDLLSNKEDEEEFVQYLITNMKLYFDKFEEELTPSLDPEITTPEYEKEKETEEVPETGLDLDLGA